jgi:hypothetical protein
LGEWGSARRRFPRALCLVFLVLALVLIQGCAPINPTGSSGGSAGSGSPAGATVSSSAGSASQGGTQAQGGGSVSSGANPAGTPKPMPKRVVRGSVVMSRPDRPTMAILPSTWASGTVRYVVTLKVIGWQGDPRAQTLVVRVTKVIKGPNKRVSRPLDFKSRDLSLHVAGKDFNPKTIDGKTVVIEFRPGMGGYVANLSK